jgi:hypothetical protein
VNQPNESIMARINKLLNMAADERTPEHERKSAEEFAERLMAQHMIEEHELRQAAERSGKRVRTPVVFDWAVNFAESANEAVADQWEFDHQVLDMMMYVIEHCNVRVNPNYKYRDGQRVYQIVGFKDDITYAERIWFNVFKTFVSNVNPHWDVDKSIEFNAYNFASAGVSWKDQVLLAEKAKDTRLEWPWRYQDTDPEADFYTRYSWTAGDPIIRDNEPWGKSIHKLKRACKKYCDSNGLDYPYAGGSKLRIATRNSFARSYRATIKQRLDDIRKLAQEGEEHVDAGKFALALVDTRERVDAEFYNVFPEFDPEVKKRKDAERMAAAQARWDNLSPKEQQKILRDRAREDAKWARRRNTARRNYRAVREDPTTRTDNAAWARGRQAAQTVNLRADEEVKKQNKKEIG